MLRRSVVIFLAGMLCGCDQPQPREAPSYEDAPPTIRIVTREPLTDQQLRRFIRGVKIQWEPGRTDLYTTYLCGGGTFTNGMIVPVERENAYMIEPDQICRLNPDGGVDRCFRVYRDGDYFYSAQDGEAEASLMLVTGRERCT